MAIEVKPIVRKFSYQGIALDDPGQNMTPDEVRDLYSLTYGELTTAEVIDHGIENGAHTYELRKQVGQKG